MKKLSNNIWDYVIGFIYGCVMAFFMLACTVSAHASEPQLQGKCIVVSTTKSTTTNTGYTIKVDNKVYKVMRGPRGGYYYMKGDKKVYLTKAQKALIK